MHTLPAKAGMTTKVPFMYNNVMIIKKALKSKKALIVVSVVSITLLLLGYLITSNHRAKQQIIDSVNNSKSILGSKEQDSVDNANVEDEIIYEEEAEQNINKEQNEIDSQNNSITKNTYEIFYQKDSDHKIQESAWAANWDTKGALATINKNPNKFSSISPTWYYLGPNGIFGKKSGAGDANFINQVKSNGIKLIPTIGSGNAEELSLMINDNDLRSSFIQSAINEAKLNNYDGIDLDLESVKLSDKDNFTNFVKEMYTKTKENGLLLTVTLLPKTTDEDIAGNLGVGTNESRLAQDYKELSKYADEIRIMGYEYSRSGGLAGPIAPLHWLEEILKYSEGKIDKNKLVLGLPLYVYNWQADKKGAKALVYKDIVNIKNSNYQIISEGLDNLHNEKFIIYNKSGVEYEAWYQDNEVNNLRLNLAKEYKIKGVIYWRLGGDFF